MSISEAAAVSAGQVRTQIQTAIFSKVMDAVKARQQGVAGLIEDAVATMEQVQAREPGKGVVVDVSG